MDTGTMIAMVPVILLIMVMLYEKYKGRFYLHLLSKGKIELDPITKYVYNDLKDHPMRWKFSGDLVINVVDDTRIRVNNSEAPGKVSLDSLGNQEFVDGYHIVGMGPVNIILAQLKLTEEYAKKMDHKYIWSS